MRFWGVSPLLYIKSEEISPVKRMNANEWGSQPAHSAKRSPHAKAANDFYGESHSFPIGI